MKPVTQHLWLGFPLSVATNFAPEAAQSLMNRLNLASLEKLFLETFLNVLKKQDKELRLFLRGLKHIVKKDKEKLFELFNANTKHFSEFFNEIQDEEFRNKMAEAIVLEFSLNENLLGVMVLIVKDSLEMYKDAFLQKMNDRRGIKLLFHQQPEK